LIGKGRGKKFWAWVSPKPVNQGKARREGREGGRKMPGMSSLGGKVDSKKERRKGKGRP